MSTTMQLPPSSPSSEVDDDVSHINDKSREAESSAASDTDLAIYADNDDEEQQHSMKKKIFGKKKVMRRKKYTKNSTNTSTGGTAADNAILHGASSPDEPLSGLDDSIVGSPPQTSIHQHHNNKQKRPPRQRAKAATTMYPPRKYMDDSESDYLTDSKGVEPMNNMPSAMETVLPQRSHTRRNHNNNPRRPGGRGYSTSDGYENSGHDTGWHSTEDDNTDYYLGTEDDRDNDTDGVKAVGDNDDEFGALTTKLSLLDVKGDKPTAEDKKDEKEVPTTPKSSPLPPKSSSKKKRSRRRPNKAKKSQTVQESSQLNSMQEAEELDCHTPMKTTVQQQQSQQTPKRTKQKNKTPLNQQQQKQQVDEDVEKEVHDPHEDDDDYPSNMVTTTTPIKTMEGEFCEPCGPKEEVQQKRTLDEELSYLRRISPTRYQISLGFVPNMKVPAEIIVNNDLQTLLVQELRDACCDPKSEAGASFIPAIRQAANVAALPGIVRASLAMPDVHSGYGFCIGNVAAFDMDDPTAVISPGGVGFDINCGVRLIRTSLTEDDVEESVREELAEAMFRNIPVGVGAGGDIPCNIEELDKLLLNGIDWAIEQGYAWKEDKEHCEENGCMDTADPKCVSSRAKKRGLKQIGTLGAGNHYAEIQVVDEIYDTEAAETMGIGKVGQVCIMIHTGSRGLGHQVATDALTVMERAMARDKIDLNDRQLSCARICSNEGKEYLAGMSAAANFAWVNRACITYLTRKAFSEVFKRTADEMDMHLVYDVCHNIAKVEKHTIDGEEKTLLVHRKGSTRAFPPYHKNIPEDYQSIGQPVLIGGTMGTCSYVLVGTDKGMTETFGSTCHGAGRALSRNQSRKQLKHDEVLEQLHKSGISIRVASPKLVTEEAPESYKNVSDVIDTCQDAGISKKVIKLRPIAVIKG